MQWIDQYIAGRPARCSVSVPQSDGNENGDESNASDVTIMDKNLFQSDDINNEDSTITRQQQFSEEDDKEQTSSVTGQVKYLKSKKMKKRNHPYESESDFMKSLAAIINTPTAEHHVTSSNLNLHHKKIV